MLYYGRRDEIVLKKNRGGSRGGCLPPEFAVCSPSTDVRGLDLGPTQAVRAVVFKPIAKAKDALKGNAEPVAQKAPPSPWRVEKAGARPAGGSAGAETDR